MKPKREYELDKLFKEVEHERVYAAAGLVIRQRAGVTDEDTMLHVTQEMYQQFFNSSTAWTFPESASFAKLPKI